MLHFLYIYMLLHYSLSLSQFLVDTFNALFAIIEEKGEKYGDPVFEALILIIGLLVVEKYENFRPVLDSYCEKHFNVTSIHT